MRTVTSISPPRQTGCVRTVNVIRPRHITGSNKLCTESNASQCELPILTRPVLVKWPVRLNESSLPRDLGSHEHSHRCVMRFSGIHLTTTVHWKRVVTVKPRVCVVRVVIAYELPQRFEMHRVPRVVIVEKRNPLGAHCVECTLPCTTRTLTVNVQRDGNAAYRLKRLRLHRHHRVV